MSIINEARWRSLEDPYFDTSQTAHYVNSTRGHLAQLRHRGTGPKFIKFSPRRVLYRKSDLDSWLRERERDIT